MDVREFLDAHDTLYSDVPKGTAADVPIEDLYILHHKGELFLAIDRKTGAFYRAKRPNTKALKDPKIELREYVPAELTPEESKLAREALEKFREDDR